MLLSMMYQRHLGDYYRNIKLYRDYGALKYKAI